MQSANFKIVLETPEHKAVCIHDPGCFSLVDTLQKVEELRTLVKDHATNASKLSDLYLARWLITKDWDVSIAAKMFIESMVSLFPVVVSFLELA